MKSGGGLVVNAVCCLSSRLRPCLKDIHREGSTGSGATRNGSGGGQSEGWDGWTVGRKRKDAWKACLWQKAYNNQTEV